MFGFWKKKSKAPPAPTVRVAPPPPAPLNEPFADLAPDSMAPQTGVFNLPLLEYSLDAWLQSDIGCTRQVNQDSGHIYLGSPKGVLAVVADGMGGHKGGEVASQLAVQVLGQTYFAGSADPQTDLDQAFAAANAAIYREAQQNPELQGMGTTCTALVILNGTAYSTHVGDSRLYLVRAGGYGLRQEDVELVLLKDRVHAERFRPGNVHAIHRGSELVGVDDIQHGHFQNAAGDPRPG